MSLREFDAASGAAMSETAVAEPAPEFATIAIDLIVASRTNPRRTFDEGKLKELAASIASIGVMQPILVRPLPADRLADTSVKASRKDKRAAYEIISGERRWRASTIAGKTSIPAVVRAMTDDQVLEAQLVENLQRDDLHPLEEADGYRRLCEATGIAKEDVAGKIGKSRSYVYNRLKLLTLTAESVQAFRDGKLDASRAELLATVADPKLQLKALKEFTEVGYGDRRKSVRECSTWLQDNILLKLNAAPFDTKDDTLVDGCGACTACPKRTHADRDLFAAFDGPDMCTDAPCFRAKETSHLARLRVDAESKGMTLIAGKEAKKLKPSSYTDSIAGHTKLSAKVETSDGEVTVASVIKDMDIKPILFVDPHDPKKTHKIVPTEAVEQALKDKGLIKETRSDQARKVDAAAERERKKLEIQQKHRDYTIEAVSERIRDGAVTAFSAPVLRMIAHGLLHEDGNGTSERDHTLSKLWGLPSAELHPGWEPSRDRHQALHRRVDAMHDSLVAPMVLQILIAGEAPLQRQRPGTFDWTTDTPAITQLAEETGVNVNDILTIVKEEFAEKEHAAKAARTPPAGAKDQAAPQGSDRAGDKPKRGRRGKTTAEEAQQGIAEAMQDMDAPAGESDLPEDLGDDAIELLTIHGLGTKAALQAAEPAEVATLLGCDILGAKELMASLEDGEAARK